MDGDMHNFAHAILCKHTCRLYYIVRNRKIVQVAMPKVHEQVYIRLVTNEFGGMPLMSLGRVI